VKLLPGIDVIDPRAPPIRICRIRRAVFLPEPHDEDLIQFGGQRGHSPMCRSSIGRRTNAGVLRRSLLVCGGLAVRTVLMRPAGEGVSINDCQAVTIGSRSHHGSVRRCVAWPRQQGRRPTFVLASEAVMQDEKRMQDGTERGCATALNRVDSRVALGALFWSAAAQPGRVGPRSRRAPGPNGHPGSGVRGRCFSPRRRRRKSIAS
jgi:hypothetical protein